VPGAGAVGMELFFEMLWQPYKISSDHTMYVVRTNGIK
jgi:hypothetical protein